MLIHQTIFSFLAKKQTRESNKLNIQEEFEDTKGVIRIRTSVKNRQHNGQMKN